ncbi:MAG: zf-HC2 domain-containing protein, partial [candidate division Zixibacteria bacterium]|nr:zf-HC2 domain-containing protein [candidate division Zixibacteria bacterium]
MSDCTDKRYEQLLHAFELGMLNDDDRLAFQEHLLNCPHCFEQARAMEDVADLMRNDDDIRQIPHDAASDATASEDMSTPSEVP